MSIKINYLYRDAGNFKSYGFVTFSNPTNRSAAELEPLLRSALLDGEYFSSDGLLVPDLRPTTLNEEFDHGWHELEALEESPEDSTDKYNRSIEAFLYWAQTFATVS
jgi:hypothetical protein